MNKNIFLGTFFLIFTVISLLYAPKTSALYIDDSCKTVETVYARGSGAEVDDPKEPDEERKRFFSQLNNRLTSVPQHQYNLGTESYGGHQYPAVPVVGGWNFLNALGASLSTGQYFAYGNSVKDGVGELQSYLQQRYTKCKSSGTWYVLGGYSQGAQVVGQALPGISKEIRDRIVFVGLFGDPKLHYPEGEGINPPACRGQNLSPWRRAASNCNLDNGSLSARIPYLPDDMKTKTGLWCYTQDQICDIAAAPHTEGHTKYKEEGRAIDEAALEAAMRLARVLPATESTKIDVGRKRGSGTTGIDTVFVIDTTGSMNGKISQAQTFARTSADKIKAQNGRVALVEYRDQGDAFTARILSGFDDDYTKFTSSLDGLRADGGGDYPEATLHALMTAFNGLSWKNGATKAAVVLTDASFHTPDTVDGSTVASVAKRSLEIDPVNIYPVVPNDIADVYQELATQTSGQVIIDSGDTVNALDQALTKIQERPVVLLKNTDYSAEPGQSVTFDASDSYVVDATITKYEWDFDGDGTFDTTTTSPNINHVYATNVSGAMQVRVTASNGTIANGSASVTIAPVVPPVLPGAPKNLTYTVTKTTENKSTVRLNWTADPTARKWLIRINDMPVGVLDAAQTSVEFTDVERSDDVTFSVAGATPESQAGNYTTITLPAISSQPPITSTCTQPNLILRALCKAIAFAKLVIAGVVTYFLPWAV